MLQYISNETIEKLLDKKNESPIEVSQALADILRLNTLFMIKKAGSGHIGSSFSSLDIVLWLHIFELNGNEIYFSSKGHDVPALYSVLIGLGKLPAKNLHQLRRLGGLPGHPDVHTPNIITNTGSLGMGVSKAKGFALANRLKGEKNYIYVLTGDGELQEGQFWESLVSAANNKLDEITVIVDHNKVQSDTWVSDVCDLGDLESKFASFGWYVQRCDGHDFNQLKSALANAKASDKPSAIIADTIKGCGVSFMQATDQSSFDGELYQYHSGAPSNEDYDKAVNELVDKINSGLFELNISQVSFESEEKPQNSTNPRKLEKLVSAYGEALVEAAEENKNMVALDADLVLDCGLIPFKEKYPERFVECGIAEQDMVSQAGAMALSGLLPVVHSFACFLTTRATEQMYNNASEKSKVLYVGSLAGLIPSGPGHSHQSVRDIALMGSLPGVAVFQPSCEREVNMAVKYFINCPESGYLRLVSVPYAVNYDLPNEYYLEKGKGVLLLDGKDVAIISYGPVMLTEAIKAAKYLRSSHGIESAVFNMPWLNVVDQSWFLSILSNYSKVIVVDDHYKIGGLGERLQALSCELSSYKEVFSLGLTSIPACGQIDEVLRHHKLDGLSIANFIKKVFSTVKPGLGKHLQH